MSTNYYRLIYVTGHANHAYRQFFPFTIFQILMSQLYHTYLSATMSRSSSSTDDLYNLENERAKESKDFMLCHLNIDSKTKLKS